MSLLAWFRMMMIKIIGNLNNIKFKVYYNFQLLQINAQVDIEVLPELLE